MSLDVCKTDTIRIELGNNYFRGYEKKTYTKSISLMKTPTKLVIGYQPKIVWVSENQIEIKAIKKIFRYQNFEKCLTEIHLLQDTKKIIFNKDFSKIEVDLDPCVENDFKILYYHGPDNIHTIQLNVGKNDNKCKIIEDRNRAAVSYSASQINSDNSTNTTNKMSTSKRGQLNQEDQMSLKSLMIFVPVVGVLGFLVILLGVYIFARRKKQSMSAAADIDENPEYGEDGYYYADNNTAVVDKNDYYSQ